MDTEQLLLFLTGNAANGGFKSAIARGGIDRFMAVALRLEVSAFCVKLSHGRIPTSDS